MAVPCVVCLQDIVIKYTNGVYTGDETTHVMYAGDEKYESGRYNIHDRCNRPEFNGQILSRDMFDGKTPIPKVVRA